MTPDPEAALAKVRALCLALPDAEERLSHGSPGFFIKKGKFFAYFWHNHHNDGETVAIAKTSGRDEQAMLIEADPDFYYAPPYMGPSGWIAMRLDGGDLDWDRVANRITLSWKLVAPRHLLEDRA